MGKRLADGIDDMAKLSTSLQANVKDLQALEQAAMLQGVAWTQVTKGLVNFRDVLGSLSSGEAYVTQIRAWERLNLNIDDFIKLNPADQVAAMGKAMMESVPAAEQISVAAELVGKKAAPGFIRMAQEVAAAQARLEEFGLVLSEEGAKDVEAANDAIGLLGNAFTNLGRILVADAAPGITAWATGIMESLKPGGDLRKMIESLIDGFKLVAGTIGNLVGLVSPFVNGYTLMAGAIYLVGKRVIVMGTSLKAAAASVWALKVAKDAGIISITRFNKWIGILKVSMAGLFGVGGIILLAVSAFMEYRERANQAKEATEGLADATDKLTLAQKRAREADLKAKLDHARSDARLQEIISMGHGYITREQALKTQAKEIDDLEARLDKLQGRTDAAYGSVFDRINFGKNHLSAPQEPGVDMAAYYGYQRSRMFGEGGAEGAGWTGGNVHDMINFGKGHVTGEGGESAAAGDPAAAYIQFQRSMVEAGVAEVAEANREAAARTKKQWQIVGNAVKSSLGSAIDGIIDGSMKIGDIFNNLLRTMAKMAVKWAIFGGPAGGAGGGIFGSIFGFKNGGHTPGGFVKVGENGEELVRLPRGSRVYNNAESRRMARGGGGHMSFSINVTASNGDALRNEIQSQLNAAIPRIMEAERAAYITDVSRPSDTRTATRAA